MLNNGEFIGKHVGNMMAFVRLFICRSISKIKEKPGNELWKYCFGNVLDFQTWKLKFGYLGILEVRNCEVSTYLNFENWKFVVFNLQNLGISNV